MSQDNPMMPGEVGAQYPLAGRTPWKLIISLVVGAFVLFGFGDRWNLLLRHVVDEGFGSGEWSGEEGRFESGRGEPAWDAHQDRLDCLRLHQLEQ